MTIFHVNVDNVAVLFHFFSNANQVSNPQSEGGGLMAVGLIHCGYKNEIVDEMLRYHLNSSSQMAATDNSDQQPSTEPIHHGAALALGFMHVGSHNSEVTEELFEAFSQDNSVIGEGAAYAIGMIQAASCNFKYIDRLITVAKGSEHQKVKRGCGVAVSLILTGAQSLADRLIEELLSDHDPFLRFGGVWSLGTAYAKTSNTKTLEKLLGLSVLDAHVDVKRTAAICIGFVMAGDLTGLVPTVQLLNDSANFHIRYASAIALGVGAASTADISVLKILRPMLEDHVPLVRYGAGIALGMVVSGAYENEINGGRIQEVHSDLLKIGRVKQVATLQSSLPKFGALIGLGLANVGGGNMQIGMIQRDAKGGITEAKQGLMTIACAGMTLFCNAYYWNALYTTTILFSRSAIATPITHRLNIPADMLVWHETTDIPKMFESSEFDAQVPVKKQKRHKGSPLMNRRMLQRKKKPAKVTEEDTADNVDIVSALTSVSDTLLSEESTTLPDPKKPIDSAIASDASKKVDTPSDNVIEAEVQKEDQANEQQPDDKNDELPERYGCWMHLPLYVNKRRRDYVSSSTKELPKKFTSNALAWKPSPKGSPDADKPKPPYLDASKANEKVARYEPLVSERISGTIFVVDRFSELKSPLFASIANTLEHKSKRRVAAEAEAAEGRAKLQREKLEKEENEKNGSNQEDQVDVDAPQTDIATEEDESKKDDTKTAEEKAE